MSPCPAIVVSAVLLAMVPGTTGRLSQPASGHQLTASGVASEANPQVDSWHDAEKRRIEAECDAMMRKLWAEKRQKLQDIVDAARRRVEEEMRRVRAAEAKAQGELDELERAKAAVKDVPNIDLGPTKDAIADQERKIAELERLIAEKNACLDELRQAQADLEEALRKLAEAQRKLQAAEADVNQQRATIQREESDIPPAQADVESAEADYARAKARHEAAERRLSKAKGDLSEHDSAGAGAYSAVADVAPSSVDAPAPPRAPSPPSAPAAPKSGAQGVLGPAATALLLATLLF